MPSEFAVVEGAGRADARWGGSGERSSERPRLGPVPYRFDRRIVDRPEVGAIRRADHAARKHLAARRQVQAVPRPRATTGARGTLVEKALKKGEAAK